MRGMTSIKRNNKLTSINRNNELDLESKEWYELTSIKRNDLDERGDLDERNDLD